MTWPTPSKAERMIILKWKSQPIPSRRRVLTSLAAFGSRPAQPGSADG